VYSLFAGKACSCGAGVRNATTDFEYDVAANAHEVSPRLEMRDEGTEMVSQMCSVPRQNTSPSYDTQVLSVTDQPVIRLESDNVVNGCNVDETVNVEAVCSSEVQDKLVLGCAAQSSAAEVHRACKSQESASSTTEDASCEDDIGKLTYEILPCVCIRRLHRDRTRCHAV